MSGDRRTLALVAPENHHDALLRDNVAPLVRALRAALPGVAVFFERLNKPDWCILVHACGPETWLTREVEPVLMQLGSALRERGAVERQGLVPDDADDKWIGHAGERPLLDRIAAEDTLTCLDLLALEARGVLCSSRAEWSFAFVLHLLELLGLDETAQIEFHRRGWRWAVDLGRWTDAVFETLESKYLAQREALRVTVVERTVFRSEAGWGGAEAEALARRGLAVLREPVQDLLTACSAGLVQREILDLAVLIAHGHSNRLGIHATQEAVMRYLAGRALEERRESAP